MKLSENSYIYRYIPIDQFLFITEKKLFPLSRITSWPDTYEAGMFEMLNWKLNQVLEKARDGASEKFDQIVPEAFKASKKTNHRKKNKPILIDYLQGVKNSAFATSWTSLKESDAMWRIYSQNGKGVKIRTKVKFLKDILASIIEPTHNNSFNTINNVSYVKYNKDGMPPEKDAFDIKNLEVFFYKRKEFAHEREVRGVVFPLKKDPKGNSNVILIDDSNVLYCKIPKLEVFIDFVEVDPRSEGWYVDSIKSYCEKYDLKCEKSQLYKQINE